MNFSDVGWGGMGWIDLAHEETRGKCFSM